ncbi:unnamed protein product [Gongylonema pulchrum]|uniref:Arrestin_N domain-containing protein n=1 Tax=Gongylonema pulchrum TaxID=637853 RepID=A0A183D640_9BILA|nr:unnamed protein product [Gongylonema pulchrum]
MAAASTSKRNAIGINDKSSPYNIDIFLKDKIYHPGDTIQGEVVFILDKALRCDRVDAQLLGSFRVFWIDKQVLSIWISLDDIIRFSSATAIRAKKIERGSFEGLKIGKHSFEFTFQLPKQGLHTSFSLADCHARVQYCINVSICFCILNKRASVTGAGVTVRIVKKLCHAPFPFDSVLTKSNHLLQKLPVVHTSVPSCLQTGCW